MNKPAESAPRPRRVRNSRADGIATRERIIEVATRMFAAEGFEATSLRQIASAAEIDLATLKYHVGDKASLYLEAYRVGHAEFIAIMAPFLERFGSAATTDDVRALVEEIVRQIHDFAESHVDFLRMVLYRWLQEPTEEIPGEEELDVIALDLIDRAILGLVDRGLIRTIDTRAFVTVVISSFAMWFVATAIRPKWVGTPSPDTPEGRRRSEQVFTDMLSRILLA